MPELKSFVTHLAAGVLGGLIGVVGLALAWGGLGGGEQVQTQPDIAALEARIAKLESVKPPSGDAAALDALKAQVDALATSANELSPKLADLGERVAPTRNGAEGHLAVGERRRLGRLRRGHRPADRRGRAAARQQDRRGAGQGRGRQRLRAAADAERDRRAQGQDRRARRGRARHRRTARACDAELDRAHRAHRQARGGASRPCCAIGKEKTPRKAAAVAIAFANLRAAVSDGRPYAAELDTIGALAPSVGDLGVLPAYAEKGIPTVPELARAFAVAQGRRAGRGRAAAGRLDCRQPAGERAVARHDQARRRARDRRRSGRCAGAGQGRARQGRPRRRREGGRDVATARRAKLSPAGSARRMRGSAPTRR